MLWPLYCLPVQGAIKPTVFSASEIDYPPFCSVDARGRADGFSVELLRAALAAMGREVTFRTGPWAEVRSWLETGAVQALPLVGRTPEREALFDFTFPYMSLHGVIVVRSETTDVRSLDDLRGRRVAVMKGDNAEEFLHRAPRGIDLHSTVTFQEALHALSEGRCDAVVIQRLVAVRLIEETGLQNLRVLHEPIDGYRQDFCFAVKKGDAAMLALLNEGLAVVLADGTYRHLHAKWFAALQLPARRRIIVGGDHAYPPYEYLDKDGRPTGYNVELTRALAREMDLDIEIRLGSWSEIVRSLEDGRIDVIQGMFHTPERGLRFEFSQAHDVSHYVGVARRGDMVPPSTLDDLAGKRVGVQRDAAIHHHLEARGRAAGLLLVDSQEQVLREVVDGRADYGLVARRNAVASIREHGWRGDLLVGRQPLLSLEYCYAVGKGQSALLATFSEGLSALKDSGEYRRIHEKWLGIDERRPPLAAVLRQAALILGPLLAVLLLISLWSWSLRRQVGRQTAELRRKEEFIRSVLDNLPVGIAVNTVEPVVQFEYMNRLFPDIYRTTPEAIADPGAFWDVIYEDAAFRDVIRSRVLDDCASGDPRRMQWDDVPITRNGEVAAYICARNIPVPEKGVMISTVWDVTERKLTEERIRHLNRVLKAIRDVNQLIVRERNRETLIREGVQLLVNHRGYASALIVLTNAEHVPTAWVGAGAAAAKTAPGGPLAIMFGNGEFPTCCQCAGTEPGDVLQVAHVGICAGCPIRGECADTQALCARLAHQEVLFGYLLVALDPHIDVDDEERDLVAEMAGDLAYALHGMRVDEERAESERRRMALEAQLAQAQKMEAVGRLAGGVAHDFNNLLMGILGYADLCRDELGADHPMREWLDEITSSAQRSAELTRQLLAFASRQTIAPKVLDMNDAITGMLKLLRRLLGENIDLAWIPAMENLPVKMDPSQIDQILANLCVNARDAIGNVGKLTIETDLVSVDDAYCARHMGAIPGRYVQLAVSDNGCGMDGETLAHIFEPFFTTKGIGKGTGLGLATVYGIVRQNDGFVNVYSEPGVGTVFRIYLPHVDAEVAACAFPESATGNAVGTETILLVEDEKSIRNMTARMLGSLGYTVLVAESPAVALRAAAAHGGEIHLLLTDVVMPGMGGKELAERLLEQRPGMKCLFMSGYTANMIAHHGVLDKGVHFIQKPVSMRTLSATIRKRLEEDA